jgi:pimeloyl-ACP methyl ester carboxylesterase
MNHMSASSTTGALGRALHPPILGRVLAQVRGSRILGAGVTLGLGASVGLVSSLPMPRGPLDAAQGLVVIATSLLVGLISGSLFRSKSSLVVAPAAYMAAYEVARIGIAGAAFGPIRLDTPYGIVALVAGRGVHGLLAVFPMVAGAAIALAARRPHRLRSVLPACVLGAATVALAAVVAIPGSVPPVVGPDGSPTPGMIAERTAVTLGGLEQTISVRGASADNPVLLYLSGGPGQSDIAFARALLDPLAADFTIVVWDQRGSGTSYAALEPTSTFTLDRAVADTTELVEYLGARFDEEKVYLLGESWGSTLGVLAVQRRPDLFHAYLGSGQMVSQRDTDRIIWRDLLAYANAAGNGPLYDEVLTMGEPPYRDFPWSNSRVMGYYELLETPYTPTASYVERGEASGVGMFGVGGREYSFLENANLLRGLLDMFSLMYPQLQGIDFREDVPRLEVPVYILDGEHELSGRRSLSHQWFEALKAPSKQLITFPDAGHAVAFEQLDEVQRLLVDEILPATYNRAP